MMGVGGVPAAVAAVVPAPAHQLLHLLCRPGRVPDETHPCGWWSTWGRRPGSLGEEQRAQEGSPGGSRAEGGGVVSHLHQLWSVSGKVEQPVAQEGVEGQESQRFWNDGAKC